MTCMKQEFCIHEKYCQRHIGQNFDSCILFSRNSTPMTNEEWLCGLSTEEKAKFLRQIYRDGRDDYVGEWYEQTESDFVEWLKQPHTEKE